MSEMSVMDAARRRLDRWLMYVPYAALAFATMLIFAAPVVPHLPVPVCLAATLVTAGWIFYWVTLRPQRRVAVFYAGLLVLIYVLVLCSPFYGFFAWTGYLYTAYALQGRRNRVIGCTAIAVATAFSQTGSVWELDHGSGWAFFGVLLFFNVTVANAMTFLSTMSDEQAAKRARMIADLAEANAKLAAALEENAGLHAQLLVQAREAGVHDERHRMAGEIHDVLAQGLTGIVTQLEAASAAAARPGDWRRHLDTAMRLARDGLSEARRSVQALRPRSLDDADLPCAIGEVVSGWADRHAVRAELITTGTPRALLPEIETTLLRTAQEALANVARHAAADRVALTLSYMEDMVTLDVRDDGAGFDPQSPRPQRADGGYGLDAMRERLLRVAGRLEIESEPGGGTALSACVPAIPIGAAA